MSESGPGDLERSLSMIAEASRAFKDPWHIIGSAAGHLAGADVGAINDIDLMLSIRDIKALKDHWRDVPTGPPAPSDQFRSKIFYCFETPLPVEAMAAFELKAPGGGWMAIEPKTRVRYGNLYAPAVSEQIEILRLMNRPKDTPRIAALEALSAHE